MGRGSINDSFIFPAGPSDSGAALNFWGAQPHNPAAQDSEASRGYILQISLSSLSSSTTAPQLFREQPVVPPRVEIDEGVAARLPIAELPLRESPPQASAQFSSFPLPLIAE
jgi:hypothetical protein